jgi:hypothetical protein
VSAVRIVVFAKAPLAGLAKTRLIPALGAEGAAELAQRMLRHTIATAMAAEVGPVELCVTPAPAAAPWTALALPEALQWSEQGAGDLGERMARAAKRVIDAGESVLLIGTDCPELSAERLQQAAMDLQTRQVSLWPTFDGGYALLGLTRFHPALFSNIAWSTSAVARVTLDRIAQLDWSVHTHAKLHDIDEPADLAWLPAGWSRAV